MARKRVKLTSGTVVEVYSVLLPSGNLVIPARHPLDRDQAIWREVQPGTPEFKRWYPVHERGPDPRKAGLP